MNWRSSFNKIFLIIPTYNESENLPRIVSAILDLGVPGLNLLVIDDNSPDGTGDIAEILGKENGGRVQVIHRPGKMGLGTAYIQGFQHALQLGADAIGQMDADFSHPPQKVIELLQALETCDVVVGSRYVKGGSLDKDWPVWRKWLSGFGNSYARTILRLSLHDVTAGFRLWRSATLVSMPLERIRSNGYVFQIEMTYVANRLGYKFQEVPIYFAERRFGASKMSFRIQMEAALRVWQLPGVYKNLRKS